MGVIGGKGVLVGVGVTVGGCVVAAGDLGWQAASRKASPRASVSGSRRSLESSWFIFSSSPQVRTQLPLL
jgi:hypothetical protein